MASDYSVSLEKILKEFSFEVLYMPTDASEWESAVRLRSLVEY